MEADGGPQRLSNISTIWDVLEKAHNGDAPAAAEAKTLLLQRYQPAVRRYLAGALRDSGTADDLAQEFAVALLRGEFRNANPQRGRFRDYVKAVAAHLVARHHRQRQRLPAALPAALPEPAAPAEDLDAEFTAGWRDQIFRHTWQALAEAQPVLNVVLRFRAAYPDMPSHEVAEQLSRQEGRPFTAASVRQALHRARQWFVRLLRDEVANTLASPTPEAVDDELRDLDLQAYCRP